MELLSRLPFALVLQVLSSRIPGKPLFGWPEWTAFVTPLSGAAVFSLMYLLFRQAVGHYRSSGS